jgi:hypothetical protein
MFKSLAGVIVFGSDQEVGELMKAIERANRSGYFTWIGSDGWGGRTIVSDGNEAQVRNVFPLFVVGSGTLYENAILFTEHVPLSRLPQI